jgi:allantoinase
MAGAWEIRSRRVVTPEGERAATVRVREGRIESVVGWDDAAPDVVLDAGTDVLLPGLVDSHVHVNEPGRTEWEGFHTATRAAAAGGITTIVDMPLNSIPVTTTAGALAVKRKAAFGQCHVDCLFWGGVVPGNMEELEPLIDAGAVGFKAFLVHSGIDDFPAASEADLRAALPILARRNVPLLVHAELDPATPAPGGDPRRYRTWLDSRPPSWENEAIALLVRLAREHDARIHVVHLSSAEAVPVLARARRQGLPISAETCPHYLTFDAETIEDGRTEYKCAPPIREHANRETLWAALQAEVIDLVVSDHSPCTPALKQQDRGDFVGAWGGIASVQLALPAVWTEARRRGVDLPTVARWMSAAPAHLASVGHRKGRIAPGWDADLVVFDPDATFLVEPAALHHRHALTPYAGRTLHGRVLKTFLRGALVYDRGAFADSAHGQLIEGRTHGFH